MIAKAIDRILQLSEPVIKDINGSTYTDKELFRMDTDLRASSIEVKTLTGLVEYIFANREAFNGWRGDFLHITDERTVYLRSELDNDRKRETIMIAAAERLNLPIGRWIEQEPFLIGVQTNFVDDKETARADILRFAGTVKDGTITEYGDDGVSQKATIKKGVTSLAEKKVPSPCILRPYRTFHEVEQPVSKFIFRMKSGREAPECALFEADGGAWKYQAMENIRDYLIKAVKVAELEIPIIA